MTTEIMENSVKYDCFICNKNIDASIIMDASIVAYTWQDSYEKEKNMLYFHEYNKHSCVTCGKDLIKWLNCKSKYNYLKNRSIEKQQLNVTLPLPKAIERCVCCNNFTPYLTSDSIYIRSGYIEGVGQFCQDCYDKTIGEHFVMREFYNDYLF